MFVISKNGVRHPTLAAVLEAVQELAVRDRPVPVGAHAAAGKEGGQVLLLQLQTKVRKDLQEVVETNLHGVNNHDLTR